MTSRTQRSLPARLLFSVPVLGWMIRDAVEGDSDAPVWAVFNVIGLIALAVILWGHAALIVAALAATALMLVGLVVVPAGG